MDKEDTITELRWRAADYVLRCIRQRDLDIDEPDYLDRAVKVFYRPEDKHRSLTIAAYWRDGYYAWLVWKGEDGEREQVHVSVGDDEVLTRTEFPEFDHLIAEL